MQNRALWTVILLAAAAPAHTGSGESTDMGVANVLVVLDGGAQATIVNRALRPIGIGQCEPELEFWRDESWVLIRRPAEGCDGELSLLMPGDSGTLPFHCPPDQGTYRLSIAMVLEREELEPIRGRQHSPPFKLSSCPG